METKKSYVHTSISPKILNVFPKLEIRYVEHAYDGENLSSMVVKGLILDLLESPNLSP